MSFPKMLRSCFFKKNMSFNKTWSEMSHVTHRNETHFYVWRDSFQTWVLTRHDRNIFGATTWRMGKGISWNQKQICARDTFDRHMLTGYPYGVAMTRGLLKNYTSLLQNALLKRRYSAKETCEWRSLIIVATPQQNTRNRSISYY